MAPRRSGLIVAISGYTGVAYTYGVIFGMTKSAADRMARDMAIELRPHGVTDIDGKVVPSLRAERGAPLWRPIMEADHGR